MAIARRNYWSRVKPQLVVIASATLIMTAAYGIRSALHSSLFLVRVVEVADQPDSAPVDAQTITALAAVPVGQINLFDLNLEKTEQRILANPWIREVQLNKRFPQTLSISVKFREPEALLETEHGHLLYIDKEGQTFGPVRLLAQSDLSLVSGMSSKYPAGIPGGINDALKILREWEKTRAVLSPSAIGSSQIDTLSWDSERGFRALMTYPVYTNSVQTRARVMVNLGREVDGDLVFRLNRLGQVLNYLGTTDLAVRQIFAELGKKVVVKTARRS